MLETSLFESAGRAKTRKPATLLLSTVIHGIIILLLVLIPIAHPQAMPRLATALGIPLPVVAKQPEAKPAAVRDQPAVQPHIIPASGEFIAPPSIPNDIASVIEDPNAATVAVVPYAPRNEIVSIIRATSGNEEAINMPPPPPPPVSRPAFVAPTRVGGNVQQANLIHRIAPEYPRLAKLAHVQGVVILEATISKEGTVEGIRVISGHPLLNEAAVKAVQQWQYKPTILNGEAVEVITTITVTFTLQ